MARRHPDRLLSGRFPCPAPVTDPHGDGYPGEAVCRRLHKIRELSDFKRPVSFPVWRVLLAAVTRCIRITPSEREPIFGTQAAGAVLFAGEHKSGTVNQGSHTQFDTSFGKISARFDSGVSRQQPRLHPSAAHKSLSLFLFFSYRAGSCFLSRPAVRVVLCCAYAVIARDAWKRLETMKTRRVQIPAPVSKTRPQRAERRTKWHLISNVHAGSTRRLTASGARCLTCTLTARMICLLLGI